MKILILEDEHLVAESLIKQVRQLEPHADIIGPIVSVEEANKVLDSTSPDIIISDIQLADGISLDVFTSRQVQCPIIFTTAYNEYAIRAFKVNSIDYLLKPIDKSELKAALDKYHLLQSKYGNDTYIQQINELFKDFRSQPKLFKERFAVHYGKRIVLVSTADIACFQKEEIIYLICKDGKRYITDFRSLDEVEELLDPNMFYRANRQYLISLDYIGSMYTDEASKLLVILTIPSPPEIIISKEKAPAFRKWLER
jgi:DNA-binding LytR/AlgR family response regulator